MPSPQSIYPTLAGIFNDVFDRQIELAPDLTSEEVEEWDSLSHIRLMISVEQAFDVRFSAAEVAQLTNVGELVNLIESKLEPV